MRLVSYNILDGGEGRADPLAETIESQRPDVVVLVEADNADVVNRIAARLKMDAAHATGKKHGAAILSRSRIVHSINHSLVRAGLSDCVLEAEIEAPGAPPITIAAVHLHARAMDADEDRRLEEVAILMEIFAAHRQANKPHLLAGDFNSNSPIQQLDPASCTPKTAEAYRANGGHIPRRAVQMILDAGYTDTLHAVKGAAAGRIGSFTTQHPGQRLDYIFSFGIERARISDAWIEQDRLARYASDHFPIGVRID